MARDESEVIHIGSEKPKKEVGGVLDSEKTLFHGIKMFLFCEGKTEYNYFKGFEINQGNSRLEIIPRFPINNECGIEKLVEQVLSSKAEGKVIVKSDESKIIHEVKDGDEFNIIFDCEKNFNMNKNGKSKMDEAKELLGDDNTLFLSNHNFEVWILCHFKKPNRSCKSTNLIKQILKESKWEKYKKNDKELFDKLKDKLDLAIHNANELIEERKNAGIKIHSIKSNPVTEIGILIKNINSQLID
ncbi:MAG: RloB domain-containing protein [Candidatus Aenigmarchaeota archaeon]|nr:RloB domain-containing protein [Candidatus Aenigmarchaeota archaeon]